MSLINNAPSVNLSVPTLEPFNAPPVGIGEIGFSIPAFPLPDVNFEETYRTGDLSQIIDNITNYFTYLSGFPVATSRDDFSQKTKIKLGNKQKEISIVSNLTLDVQTLAFKADVGALLADLRNQLTQLFNSVDRAKWSSLYSIVMAQNEISLAVAFVTEALKGKMLIANQKLALDTAIAQWSIAADKAITQVEANNKHDMAVALTSWNYAVQKEFESEVNRQFEINMETISGQAGLALAEAERYKVQAETSVDVANTMTAANLEAKGIGLQATTENIATARISEVEAATAIKKGFIDAANTLKESAVKIDANIQLGDQELRSDFGLAQIRIATDQRIAQAENENAIELARIHVKAAIVLAIFRAAKQAELTERELQNKFYLSAFEIDLYSKLTLKEIDASRSELLRRLAKNEATTRADLAGKNALNASEIQTIKDATTLDILSMGLKTNAKINADSLETDLNIQSDQELTAARIINIQREADIIIGNLRKNAAFTVAETVKSTDVRVNNIEQTSNINVARILNSATENAAAEIDVAQATADRVLSLAKNIIRISQFTSASKREMDGYVARIVNDASVTESLASKFKVNNTISLTVKGGAGDYVSEFSDKQSSINLSDMDSAGIWSTPSQDLSNLVSF